MTGLLYQRWRDVAEKYRDEVALVDSARGGRWTFAQLAAEAERGGELGPIVFPQGEDFVLKLLRGWRGGQLICPLEPGQAEPEFEELPQGCVHIKLTSATTGASRAVAFTGEQLAADADNIVATMGLYREWPNLGVISLAHSYGFSNLVLPLLLHGIPLILVDAHLPETVKRAVEDTDSFTLAAVPALWRAWHEAGVIPGSEKLKLAISAGAPLSRNCIGAGSVRSSRREDPQFFTVRARCGGIAYDTQPARRGPTWRASDRRWKTFALRWAMTDACRCAARRWAKTYWPEPAVNLADGCFVTNDLAEIEGGRVYIRGRAGDQINMAGRKLSPETIESVLLSHPDVKDCLVFGVPSADNDRSESIVACIAGARSLNRELLKQFMLEKTPAWQIPREWVFVKSLEANSRGKLSRAEWRRKFLEARDNGASDFS